MQSNRFRVTAYLFAVVGLGFFAPLGLAVDKAVTWTGNGDGVSWSDPGNWDGGEVPANDVVDTYQVTIPAGFTLDFDVAGNSNISTLDLVASATLRTVAGANVTVLDTANIAGVINADAGSFTAVGVGATLSGNQNRIRANNGANIAVGGTTFSSTDLLGNANLLLADGVGTNVSFPAVTTFDAGFDKNDGAQDTHTVVSRNGGTIDLSSVQDINVPLGFADNLIFTIPDSTSQIDLSSLRNTTIAGGRARFVVSNGASLSLPALETLGNTHLFASSGAQITITGPGPVAYTARLPFFTDVIGVDGAGSLLDLSSIVSIDVGFDDDNRATRRNGISASNGGVINLSGLQTVTPPVLVEDFLDFKILDSASQIILSSLATINGSGSGRTMFILSSGASLSLPALQTAEDVFFDLSGGAQLTAGGAQPIVYSSSDTPFVTTLVTVDGASSLLDFSSATGIDAGFNDATIAVNTHTITATNGGAIDFSNVQTITPPARPEDALIFRLSDASSQINLTSLQDINAGAGSVLFDLSGGAGLSLPALTGASNARFTLQSGAQLTLTTAQAIAYSSASIAATSTLMSASGSGTLLDLSPMVSINAGFDDADANLPSIHTITATGGGVVDLSSVQSISPPVRPEDAVRVVISGSTSQVRLAALQTIQPTGGVMLFDLSSSASLSLPALTTAANTRFQLASGARLTVAGIQPVAYSSAGLPSSTAIVSATGGGTVLDLSAISSFDAGFSDGDANEISAHTVTASGGAVVNLSGLGSLTVPLGNERIDFIANTGGTIDLSSLQTVTQPVSGMGSLRLEARNASLVVGPLSPVAPTTIDLDRFSTLTAPNGLSLTSAVNLLVEFIAGQPSLIDVTGQASLTGTLDVVLPNGFTPSYLDEFTVLTADTRVGTFDQINGLFINAGMVLVPAYDLNTNADLTLVATIPGDANLDGLVNGLDLLAWQSNLFSGNQWVQGDFNLDGLVNGLDLLIWQAHLFQNVGPISFTNDALLDVPEPSALTILWLCSLVMLQTGMRSLRRHA